MPAPLLHSQPGLHRRLGVHRSLVWAARWTHRVVIVLERLAVWNWPGI